jgi:hypothetical protein
MRKVSQKSDRRTRLKKSTIVCAVTQKIIIKMREKNVRITTVGKSYLLYNSMFGLPVPSNLNQLIIQPGPVCLSACLPALPACLCSSACLLCLSLCLCLPD